MPQREKNSVDPPKMIKIMFWWEIHNKQLKQTLQCFFNNGIATVITIQWHFSTFWGIFCKIWLFLWKNWPEISSVSQRTISLFIHNQKIFHIEPWNLAENCPIDSSFWYIAHHSTNISYVVFTIFNLRKGYPYPQNPEFLAICCSLHFM